MSGIISPLGQIMYFIYFYIHFLWLGPFGKYIKNIITIKQKENLDNKLLKYDEKSMKVLTVSNRANL